jgi:hypothetical protein
MKHLFALMLLACLFHASSVHAQECPPGISSAGNPECLPPDDSNSPYYQSDRNEQTQPAQPQAVWAKRWGAIATDYGTGSTGVSENQTSKSGASTEALQRCASKSNSQHCEVEMTYYNQCVALAWGAKYEGRGRAGTQDQAQSLALQSCQKGAPDCKIVYSACSLPARVQ